MAKILKEYSAVLNLSETAERAKRGIDYFFDQTVNGGDLYQVFIKPYSKPKTIKQNSTLYLLFNQLSETDQNEYAGHTPDWWKSFYKLKVYLPILRNQALHDEDQGFLEIIDMLGKVWREASPENKPAVEKMIAGNEALSLADATKDHLIKMIDVILKDASDKGIYLEIKKDYRE